MLRIQLENHPAALHRLQRGRTLWGNPPQVLARARDPAALTEVVRAAGLPAALVRKHPPRLVPGSSVSRWLLKPRASGGGHGIVPWSPGAAVPRSCVLQQRMPGRAASVLFAADGERAIVLGVTLSTRRRATLRIAWVSILRLAPRAARGS